MLKSLKVKDFALIDDIELEFAEGLNVLTGETGAGKSLIVDCLALIAGGRADAQNVKRGTEAAAVEAAFDITYNERAKAALAALELDVDAQGTVILSREVQKNGKSRARIDGILVSAGELAQVAEGLIDIFGQHDGLGMMKPSSQLAAVDSFLSEEGRRLLKGSAEAFRSWRKAAEGLEELMAKAKDRQSRLDFLEYQIKELEEASVKPGEEAELLAEAKVLANSGKLFEALTGAYSALYDTGSDDPSAVDLARTALDGIISAGRLGMDVKDAHDPLAAAVDALADAAEAARRIRDSIDLDPARAAEVEGRLADIGRMKRKFGLEADELGDFCLKCKAEAAELRELEIRTDSARNELEQKRSLMLGLMAELGAARQKAAQELSDLVEKQLSELMMPRAEFVASITLRLASEGFDTGDGRWASASGLEKVEFLFSANVGEEPKPLAKVASGGELSRFMLAFKVAGMKHQDNGAVMVFDEVDQGVGGAAANHVAAKLKEVSVGAQALAVTHIAQIAAAADRHILITKSDDGERSYVSADSLIGDARPQEIARMLSGSAGKEAVEHANTMLRAWEKNSISGVNGARNVTKGQEATFSLFERVD